MAVTGLTDDGRVLQGVRLGVRIQFYDKVPHDGAPQQYRGSAYTEDSFTASAVPRVGEAVSLVAFVGGSPAGLGVPSRLQPWHGGPFLTVVAVEHYPIPTAPDGRLPTWWTREWATPGVNLVFHAETPRDQDCDTPLTATLRAQGWTVDDQIDN